MNALAIIQLIMAGLSAFSQVWGSIHGVATDMNHMATTAALGASGLAHLKNGNGKK